MSHDAFVKPARAKSELWRTVIGFLMIAVLYIIGIQIVAGAFINLFGPDSLLQLARGTTPFGMGLLLATFGFAMLATGGVTRLIHSRSLATLIGPLPAAFRDGLRVLAWLLPFQVGVLVFMNGDLSMTRPPVIWLSLLPVTAALVLIQVSAEEVLFRGYLQQQLAARISSPIIWLLGPSLLFGLLHYAPDEYGSNTPYILIWSFFFGIIAADLTARTGNLGAAIAVHFASNAVVMLLAAPKDSLNGLSLYTLPFRLSDEDIIFSLLPAEFLILLISWLVARLALRV